MHVCNWESRFEVKRSNVKVNDNEEVAIPRSGVKISNCVSIL